MREPVSLQRGGKRFDLLDFSDGYEPVRQGLIEGLAFSNRDNASSDTLGAMDEAYVWTEGLRQLILQ